MNRRVFLKSGACALLATTTIDGQWPSRFTSVPRFLVRAAGAAPARRKVLVAIFQRGAVDGLSMVMPHGDPAYASLRANIALQPPRRADGDCAIDLDGFFALHPALAPLGRCGSRARSRSYTRAARPTSRARTSTRRTTWRAGRPA